MKNTLVILGHPQSNSFCGALAKTYVESAQKSGINLKTINLGELTFDPIFWNSTDKTQELEPDLIRAQEAITWAEHIVFIYPIWWGTMPALLKGFFDRIFLPGFAYKYRDNLSWDKLLTGKSAHVFVTMDTPPWYYRWIYKMPGHNQIKRNILEYSGIKPVKINAFGPLITSTEKQRKLWINKVAEIAKNS